jgi:hypothetical protein
VRIKMVDVTPTQLLTFKITRQDGSTLSVVACDDQSMLQSFGGQADKRVLIKRTDMTADKV